MEKLYIKKCKDCLLDFSLNNFYKYLRNKDGYRNECKSCWYKKSRRWLFNNQDKCKEYLNKYRGRYTKRHHQYYLDNKEKILQKTYNWRKKNIDKFKSINAKSRLNNIGKRKLYEKKRYWNNPEYFKYKISLWRKENPEKVKTYLKTYSVKWRIKNKEKVRQSNKNRKAILRGGIGKITYLDWLWLKEKYFYVCVSCYKREPEIKLTMDHIIPLSLGGYNVIDNIQPLCRSCNSTKHTKTIDYRFRTL